MAGKITTDGKAIFISGKPHEMLTLRRGIGGRWTGQQWKFPLFKASDIDGAFPASYERSGEFLALVSGTATIQEAYQYKAADSLEPIPVTAGPDPWQHQLQAYHFAMHLPKGCMLYMGMATGKSRVAVDVAQNKGARLILVATTLATMDDDTWQIQFSKYHAAPFQLMNMQKGTVAKRIERAKQFLMRPTDDTRVIVANHAAFQDDKFVKWALSVPWDLFIIDESSKLKSASGVQSKGATKVANSVPFKLALTGTPNPHSILDTFAQFRMLDSSVFGTTITEYKAEYIIYENIELGNGRVVPKVVGFRNEDGWREKFYSLAFYVGREVLDLPEAHHVTRSFTLEPSAWKLYRELKEDYVTAINHLPDCELCANERTSVVVCYQCNGVGIVSGADDLPCSMCWQTGTLDLPCPACMTEVVAKNVLAQAMKLHQLTGGYLEGHQVSQAKFNALVSVLDELPDNEPVVVMCRFAKDIEQVHNAANFLGRECLELSGKVKQTKEWQAGKASVLAVQIASGAMGIDLTRAAYCVYFSVGTSLGDYQQSEARIHRPGQNRQVTYFHLVAKGTIDASIRRALRNRESVLARLMHDRLIDDEQDRGD